MLGKGMRHLVVRLAPFGRRRLYLDHVADTHTHTTPGPDVRPCCALPSFLTGYVCVCVCVLAGALFAGLLAGDAVTSGEFANNARR